MTATIGDRAVFAAREWIGTPYQHQASCRGAGADCLGLVRGVWKELFGEEPEAVPAYSRDWSEAIGHELLWAAAERHLILKQVDDVAPGDVLLFRVRDGTVAKHLGIQSGLERFIHAYSGHAVMENSFSKPWRRRLVARFSFPEGDY